MLPQAEQDIDPYERKKRVNPNRSVGGYKSRDTKESNITEIANELEYINPAYGPWYRSIGKGIESINKRRNPRTGKMEMLKNWERAEKALEYLEKNPEGIDEINQREADRWLKEELKRQRQKEELAEQERLKAQQSQPTVTDEDEDMERSSIQDEKNLPEDAEPNPWDIKESSSIINFLQQLKKVANINNDPYLMAAMITRYSQQLDEIDPTSSIKLLKIAEGILNE